eukprot:TRINITY_DN19601_c0_g1_i1.p1 TRINITY_DN19601_c0_g1~~TRINITY_DN19601_c0_g1_i1.p1  ORF type:complete len:1191 (+),score=164.86 TRINITY_DN19601_c0_g1_i1:71-3574(+)
MPAVGCTLSTGKGGSTVDPADQYVWIYCKCEAEARRIASVCVQTRHIRRAHEIIADVDRHDHLTPEFKLCLQEIPMCYASHGWDELCADVFAWLTASSAQAARQKQPMRRDRHPPLFVTDLRRLCQICSKVHLHPILAEACGVSIAVADLLPVVLTQDFTTFSGEAVEQPAMRMLRSTVFQTPETLAITSKSESESSPKVCTQEQESSCVGSPASILSVAASRVQRRKVQVVPGVYVQRADLEAPNVLLTETTDCTRRATATEGRTTRCAFRCLILLSNGQCAYSAVSLDGTRAVEAGGSWEVLNGQIVIRGSGGDDPYVRHVALVGSEIRVLGPEHSYSEPVHISLEALEDDFEVPVTLTTCASRLHPEDHIEFDRIRSRCDALCQPGVGCRDTENSLETRGAFESGKLRPKSNKFKTGGGVADAVAHPPLGAHEHAKLTTPRFRIPQLSLPKSVTTQDSALQNSTHVGNVLTAPRRLVGFFPLCPLKPGCYTFEFGAQGSVDHRSLKLTLHGDGQYAYYESRSQFTVESVHRRPRWHVEDDTLVLSFVREDTDEDDVGFEQLELRGKFRKFVTKIARVEMFVSDILGSCTYTPSPQITALFPGHIIAADISQHLCGIVDPMSPALASPPLCTDGFSVIDFEAQLQRLGFGGEDEESVVDLSFLDEDHHGMVGLGELTALAACTQVAKPELLCGLCDALERVFQNLPRVFELLKAEARDQLVSADVFERFLRMQASKPECKPLAEWLNGCRDGDVVAVFASLNQSNRKYIELEDFVALSLQRGMMAVRLMEHFRRFMFNTFGTGEEHFRRAFDIMNLSGNGFLTERSFVEGAKQIGYVHRPSKLSCIFALLDTRFTGRVAVSEFQSLRKFTSKRFVSTLKDFKAVAEKLPGGLKTCFENLLVNEGKFGDSSGSCSSVSFTTFEKCGLGGLEKILTTTELRRIFLFLDVCAGTRARGFLTATSFGLLESVDHPSIRGSAMSLQRFLVATYGSIEHAFVTIQKSCLLTVISQRLERTAFSGLIRACRACGFIGPIGAERLRTRKKNLLSGGDPPLSLCPNFAATNELVENSKQPIPRGPSTNICRLPGGASSARVQVSSLIAQRAPSLFDIDGNAWSLKGRSSSAAPTKHETPLVFAGQLPRMESCTPRLPVRRRGEGAGSAIDWSLF